MNRTFSSIAARPGSRTAQGRFAVAEVALAAFVILVVGLMIVPLPTWVLDLLIATNLSFSVVVLLVVLYVPDAIGIATFPTLLLLTTLFRLSLNVASTRLILLQANAGQVIRAFGTFVVRGNYVVGGVVFLVLTIIQFIVVAKGSERVAEVGARFALDAMPGKQMAIDAELRGGSIDGAEARRRRRLLQRESQFYGAMDGGMKFVKGNLRSDSLSFWRVVQACVISDPWLTYAPSIRTRSAPSPSGRTVTRASCALSCAAIRPRRHHMPPWSMPSTT